MHNVVLSIPVIFVMRAYAKEFFMKQLLMTPSGNKHDLMHKVVDELVDVPVLNLTKLLIQDQSLGDVLARRA